MMNIQVFLIAIEDNGQSGQPVGCGDSLISVIRQVQASDDTATIIERALSSLFGIEDRDYGESGLVNALYQSDLTVDAVTVDGTEAAVELSGELLSGGVCDDPRIVGQIQETVLAVDGVDSAVITVNGTPLEDYFDLSGE